MQKKLTILATLVAVLIFAGHAFASNPANQNRGMTRPAATPAQIQQSPMTQQRTMERQMDRQQLQEHRPMQADQRGERRGPQANLPEEAGDTARAAVENAGMGTNSADAVKATTPKGSPAVEPGTSLPGAEIVE